MGFGAAERLESRHALEGLAARDVEDDRIPGRRGDRVRVLLQAAAPEIRPRVLRRAGDRGADVPLVEQALDPPGGDQLVVQAAAGSDVGVLEVDELEARVIPADAVAG